jgi:hypothetical protein
MLKTAQATGGRLSETGVWQNPKTAALEPLNTQGVTVTGHGTAGLHITNTLLNPEDCFDLHWNLENILTAKPGYGAETVDMNTGFKYYAQAQMCVEDNPAQRTIRIDCIDKLWWWLEVHAVFE